MFDEKLIKLTDILAIVREAARMHGWCSVAETKVSYFLNVELRDMASPFEIAMSAIGESCSCLECISRLDDANRLRHDEIFAYAIEERFTLADGERKHISESELRHALAGYGLGYDRAIRSMLIKIHTLLS